MLDYFLFISIILLFFFVVGYSNYKDKKQFELEYSEFLSKNEGMELFCYTNREKFEKVIETKILPSLDESIHVVKLIGKEATTNLDKKYISHALYRIKNIGFPNVMRVVNGQLLDVSLHSEIYNSINNEKSEELVGLVNSKIELLRQNK
jgi:hypothetical protein